MPSIKINIEGRDPIFTGMRIYRRANDTSLWDAAYLIATEAAADSFTDSTDSWLSDVPRYIYGVEFFTAAGITYRAPLIVVRNRYNKDYLHCAGLDHPYVYGDDSFGLWRQDTAKLYVPAAADVAALIKSKYNSFTPIGVDNHFLYSYKGKVIYGGFSFVSVSATQSAMAPILVNTFVNPINALADGYDASWEIVKNGARWRLYMPDTTEVTITGQLYNTAAANYRPTVPAGTNNVNTVSHTTIQTFLITGIAADGMNTGYPDRSTTTMTIRPAISLKYMGRL